MCTSIFTMTKDGKHLLSRTMDFSFPLDPNPLFLPRDHQWSSDSDQQSYQNKYGFIGAGRLLGSSYFVADGVNEKGLSIAELYLPGEVYYSKEEKKDALNLAPHELVVWVLGNCGSIAELEQHLSKIHLVEKAAPVLNFVTPLHWIITDKTGRCIVIEPTEEKLSIYENTVGVMTNTPCIEWHVTNLSNYLHVRPQQYDPITFGTHTANPFSQGTGTTGLPGGYTPPDRFVRAAFFKEHISQAPNEVEGVSNAYHILATVRIPKGIVVTGEGALDYSQYVGTMCNESLSYYFSPYENYQISKVTLTDELLKETKPKFFEADHQEAIKSLN